jgi:cytochrome d ubiquinol oxidase subunit II
MMLDLPFIWAGIIAFAVLAYVVLDGFDLGIGILFPVFEKGAERDRMMNTVAPVWDGNETWLVLGGGGLMAAFPLAYAVVRPALYAPLVAMLLGLVLRGVAFEFRWKTRRGQFLWDWAFAGGSMVAAVAQGVALGALVQGIPVAGRTYAGGWWNWLTPFSILTGVALVMGYALLGSTWLIAKTDGAMQEKARRLALPLMAVTLGLIGAVSLWTPLLNPDYWLRWFSWPLIAFSWPIPALLGLDVYWLYSGLVARKHVTPFVAALGIFILCYAGIGISFYPNIVPPSLSIWQAASPDKSLAFLLVGAVVLVPIILAYTAYAYWVFRGKVREGAGYH